MNWGVHTIVLEASDSLNEAVQGTIQVEVIDNVAPILSPVASTTILWPPNHKMVDIGIIANAADNSGGSVLLSASVASSEPPDTLGDGTTIPDFTEPLIDQTTGVISLQLRSERAGKGVGRIYTITIKAVDEAGNESTATVNISAPHDRGSLK